LPSYIIANLTTHSPKGQWTNFTLSYGTDVQAS